MSSGAARTTPVPVMRQRESVRASGLGTAGASTLTIVLIVLLVALIAITIWLLLKPKPPGPPPAVGSVEIRPAGPVFVRPGVSFQLRVVVRDTYGRTLDESLGYHVTWTRSDDVLEDVSPADFEYSAVFRAQLVDRADVTVTAEAGGMPDLITVTIIGDTGITTVPEPLVLGDHQSADPPSVALMDAQGLNDANIRFVGWGLLPMGSGAGELAVLASARAVAYHMVSDWLGTKTTADVSSATAVGDVLDQPAEPILPVPLRVWNASGQDVTTFATSERKEAEYLFRMNAAGIDLNVLTATPVEISAANVHVDVNNALDCEDFGWMSSSAFDPTAAEIHVFYVAGISNGSAGWACPPNSNSTLKARIVFLGQFRETTAFAHELAHVFGLTAPCWGHADLIASGFGGEGASGLDQTNLMWRASESERDYLSLGQLFRMSIDAKSFVNEAGLRPLQMTRSCQTQDAADPGQPQSCPRLMHPATPTATWSPPPLCTP